jgi:hypothetical protein
MRKTKSLTFIFHSSKLNKSKQLIFKNKSKKIVCFLTKTKTNQTNLWFFTKNANKSNHFFLFNPKLKQINRFVFFELKKIGFFCLKKLGFF